MKKILFLFLSRLLMMNVSFWYTLTDADYTALDAVEERLFDLMEDKWWDADYVIWAIQQWMSNKRLTEKVNTLLVQLIDDIDYYRYSDETIERDWYMTADDCYEDEYYDADEEWCYPSQEKDLGYDTAHSHEESDEDLPIFDAYLLQEDGSLIQVEWKKDIRHQEIWGRFSDMIPVTARPDLVSINFASNPDSDTFAYVEQTNEHHEKWKIVFNVDAYYPGGDYDTQEAVYTNIHEFSHILTLNKTQAQLVSQFADEDTVSRYQQSCLTYFLQEWCLLRNSYFKTFIDVFWDADELALVWEQWAESDNYTASEYITDYAATNPWEDIAESFTHFVLKSKQTWDSEAEQKINFFYDYPELIKLRSIIRSKIK